MDYAPYLYLETIGKKTGLRREIEIWFVSVGNCFYLISEREEKANWVRNIQNNPSVSFRIGREKPMNGHARVIMNGREGALCTRVRRAFEAKYAWSEGSIVEIRPEENPSDPGFQ